MTPIKKLIIKTETGNYELINGDGINLGADLTEYVKKTDIPAPDNDTIYEEEGKLKSKQIKVDNITIEEINGTISISSNITNELTRLAEEAEKNKSVTISQADNNAIETKDDGIYVAKQTEITISNEEGNIIVKKDDGLYASSAGSDIDAYTKAEVDEKFFTKEEITTSLENKVDKPEFEELKTQTSISKENGNKITRKEDGLYCDSVNVSDLDELDGAMLMSKEERDTFLEYMENAEYVKKEDLTKIDTNTFMTKEERDKFLEEMELANYVKHEELTKVVVNLDGSISVSSMEPAKSVEAIIL